MKVELQKLVLVASERLSFEVIVNGEVYGSGDFFIEDGGLGGWGMWIDDDHLEIYDQVECLVNVEIDNCKLSWLNIMRGCP